MHKCIYNTAPKHLTNSIVMTSDTHNIQTRASENGLVQIPEPKCEFFKTSFSYQSAVLWNSLPPELRMTNDNIVFKKLYKLESTIHNASIILF